MYGVCKEAAWPVGNTKMVTERKQIVLNTTAHTYESISSGLLEVVALLQNGLTPSDRFRMRQNIPYLAELGVRVKGFTPFISPYSRLPGRLRYVRERYLFPISLMKAMLVVVGRIPGTIASYKADLTWIGRSYVPGLEGLVQLVRGPRVLDVDDAIWMTTPLGQGAAAKFAKKMDAVIANNDFVADWYSQYCRNVYVVPDGIDTNRFKRSDKKLQRDSDEFTIGWTGTASNYHELYRVELILARFLCNHPKTRLRVISNAFPKFKKIPSDQFEFRQWSAEAEGRNLNDLDVGIMPMCETEWTKGKNSNKMLCYMASGLPVVVSPVGTNKEILAMGDIGLAPDSMDGWYDCLVTLFNNRGIGAAMGMRGRAIVERTFSVTVVSAQLARIFHKIVD